MGPETDATICARLRRELYADAELNKILEDLFTKNIDHFNNHKKIPLKTSQGMANGKYFKELLEITFLLSRWPFREDNVDQQCIEHIAEIGNFTVDKLRWYYEKYKGTRLPKSLYENLIEHYAGDSHYNSLFPRETSVRNFILVVCGMGLASCVDSKMDKGEIDIEFKDELIALVRNWSKRKQRTAEEAKSPAFLP